MKAIKIPNAPLSDAFGTPVGINPYAHDQISGSPRKSVFGVDDKRLSVVGRSSKVEPTERLTVIGETPLHIAVVCNDIDSVKLLIKHGFDVNKRVVGDYNSPEPIRRNANDKAVARNKLRELLHHHTKSQKKFDPQNSNAESHAYFGEYPLAFAAAFGYIEIYDYLIQHGADPNLQDSYGNTVLHLIVIRDAMDMFKYAVRHSTKKGRIDIRNNAGLSPLTLAAKIGRKHLFLECLELAQVEIWRYSNIKCCTYPLRGIDTITDGGEIDWNSSLMSIVNGKTEEHLDMLDNMVIERLLNDKWSSFAQASFVRQLILLGLHLLFLSTAVFLRNPRDTQISAKKIICHIAEVCVLCCCILSIFTQQAKEIYVQGFNYYLQNLKSYPEKALYQCSCIFTILALPCRILYLITNNIIFGYIEDGLVSLSIPGTFLFFLFFGRIYEITGAFIVMIFEMITGDIATFGVIYIIVIVAFGQVFYLLFRDTTEGGNCEHALSNDTCANDNMCSFKNFEAWMTMVHFTLGEFDFSRFDLTHYSYLVKMLFIVFMILTPILLLNMLIASMGNTYQRVSSISEKERIRQWAQLVLTIERSCTPKQRFDYQGVYAIGADDKRDLMVIKRATKSKAAQRKGAMANWKRMGKTVLYLLKEQKTTADHVLLRHVSHQSLMFQPKAQLDNMIDTLVWEHDIDLSATKGSTSSNPNVNLGSTQNMNELGSTLSRPPSPPPPQFVTAEYPPPSSLPQRLTGDRKNIYRSELSEIRSRPSFIDYEDMEIFRHMYSSKNPSNNSFNQTTRRVSMVPVDSDGYRDLLSEVENDDHSYSNSQERNNRAHKSHKSMSNGGQNKSSKSKLSGTTMC